MTEGGKLKAARTLAAGHKAASVRLESATAYVRITKALASIHFESCTHQSSRAAQHVIAITSSPDI